MQDYRAIVDRIRGPLVPLMPAFTDEETLDLDSTCGHVAWLIEAGIPAFWTTCGTSHFMSLGDGEIMDLTRAIAGVTRGRALTIFVGAHPCGRPGGQPAPATPFGPGAQGRAPIPDY